MTYSAGWECKRLHNPSPPDLHVQHMATPLCTLISNGRRIFMVFLVHLESEQKWIINWDITQRRASAAKFEFSYTSRY